MILLTAHDSIPAFRTRLAIRYVPAGSSLDGGHFDCIDIPRLS